VAEAPVVLVTVLAPSRAPGAVPTGPVGRCLARRLLADGARVRVLGPAAELDGWPPGVELIEGTVTSPAASEPAFRGIDRLCLAGLVGMAPQRLRELTNLALAGGLRRAVVLTSHGSAFEHEYSPETWQWLAFEQALRRHGVEWTYVRPAGLFASTLVGGYPITGSGWADRIRAGRTVGEFMPDVGYPFVDERDVADIVATVLSRGGHDQQALDICGTLSSAAERARAIGAAIGRPVELEDLATAETARRAWAADGWPEVTVEVTLYGMRTFATAAETVVPVIQRQIDLAGSLLGRRPRSFADWLGDHVAAFR
jgi:uncharacterized protein YbjT (DUF2867 family)